MSITLYLFNITSILKPDNYTLSFNSHFMPPYPLTFHHHIYDARQLHPPPLPQPPLEQPLSVKAAPSLGTIICSLTFFATYSQTSSSKRCKLRSAILKFATLSFISISRLVIRTFFIISL